MMKFIKRLIEKIKGKPKIEEPKSHKKVKLSIMAIRALNRKDKK